VPLAFPVWNTGSTSNPDPSRFSCDAYWDDPYTGSPERARTAALLALDPAHPGVQAGRTFNRLADVRERRPLAP